VLVAALVLGVVTAGTKKCSAGWWVARCTGIGSAGRLRVRAGLALIVRGEFSIIIAGLAGDVAGAEDLPNRRGAPAAA
jgi:CPA2 family monovalent cation:H+ antiporter-2